MEANYIAGDRVELGGQRFDLLLSDENAKVNLNAMHFHSGHEKVLQTLRRTLPIDCARAIRLQPAANANRSKELPSKATVGSSEDSAIPLGANVDAAEPTQENSQYIEMTLAYRSWGEVFDFGSLAERSSTRHIKLHFTKIFTLWGSGQINVLRAMDSSILTQMEAVIPTAKAKVILNEIRAAGDFNIQSILEKEIASGRQRSRLQALLSKDSFAFSLFIDVETPQARSRKLFTISPDINGTQEVQEFLFQ